MSEDIVEESGSGSGSGAGDSGQPGNAIIVGLILMPFFIYLSLSIGSSVGLLKGGGGSSYGCYSEGPYGVKCD